METTTVPTSEEAMATAREAARQGKPCEFAIVDLKMPDVEGESLAVALGRCPGGPHKVI
jgi:hypothetical protein